MLLYFLLLVLCVVKIDGAEDTCTKDGVVGICTELKRCASAIQEIKNRKTPQICEFRGTDPVVCCFDRKLETPDTVFDTEKRPKPTTEFIAADNDEHKHNGGKKDECEPLPSEITAKKTGKKAWDMCVEYQQLVYPCSKIPFFNGKKRANNCRHGVDEPIISSHVGKHEFTHSVLLGFGKELEDIEWLCGGALISDRFILTAAHCTNSRSNGVVTHVAINPSDRAKVDPQKIYKVKKIFNHSQFNPPRVFYDIALLELEAPVPLDSYTVPACLQTSESTTDHRRAISTTWNTHDILETKTTRVQKINLSKVSSEECYKLYPSSVGRRAGYNDTTQVCYEDRTASKEICQDDGGNSLLVKNEKLHCMYNIIGISSFGKGCFNHSPGVYTKVEYYTYWIESVVWP